MPERAPGKWEQLCWDRQERDLAVAYPAGIPADPRQTKHPKGYWYDAEAGDRPVQFIERFCCHSKGEWAGKLIVLEEWQKRCIRIAFGWMRPDGTRRFRTLYEEIPRKNAKSTIAAGLGLYLLIADGEPGAEVYASATKKDQAKIVHSAAEAMVKKSAGLKRFVKTFRNNISCERLSSKFEPLGADSNTLDGLNPHGNIIDELHAHRDRGVWDVLDTAMGARRQPMTIPITTAGTYEPESIGWQVHDHAIKVLEGILEDDTFFAFVAAADPDADWTSPETWATANPNLGVSVKAEYLRDQCEKAKAQPSFQNTFLRLHLNVWTQQMSRWIPIEKWNECEPATLSRAETVAREQALLGRSCFGGLDLAATIDIAALALAFRSEDGFYDWLYRFWVPAETIIERSRRDLVPYDAWQRDGWLVATPGNVIDYEFIQAEIKQLTRLYQVHEIGYDPWNATETATRLLGAGLAMVEVRQGFASMSGPSKEFEKLVTARKMRHGGHPIMRWMVANVATRKDANENYMPDKKSSGEKIDGVVASIMALSRTMVNPTPESVYETEDLLIV